MKHEITLKLKLNAWVICGVLLFLNILSICLWHPWTNPSASTRQITVTGSATIESEPDQYVFSPYYQKTGKDKTKLNTDLAALSTEIIAKLKALGVADSAIKTNSNTYDYGMYGGETSDDINASFYLTITLKDKILAQSVQDYLTTTDYTGSITPNAVFSKTKQASLESQAREKALSSAHVKAEASVKALCAGLGRVSSISDIQSNDFMPIVYSSGKSVDSAISSDTSSSTYSIQAGLNEYNFSIEVTYELN